MAFAAMSVAGEHDRSENIRMTSPLVSVVMPAHNSAETISRALASALTQTYRPLEIIVVDDCSTDTTAAIVKTYEARGVRLVSLDQRQGASGARNAGVRAAAGELVAFLDSDDEWLPTKTEKQVSLICQSDQLVFVSCAASLISGEGADLGDLYRGRRPSPGPDCWKSLLACNTVATPSVVVWRQHLIELGGFNRQYKICEDQDMWIRLASRGSVGFVDESLVRVHSRVDSLSSAGHSPRVVLDVIESNMTAQRSRLTSEEIRAIRGERLEWLGRTEYNKGFLRGLPLILKSMQLGYKPLRSIAFLVSASPPARWIKRKLRTRERASGAMPRSCEAGANVKSGRIDANLVQHPMLPSDDGAVVRHPPHHRPRLIVIVDAEEEYDWRLPLSRSDFSVRSMAAQVRAQRIYERFGVIPTYALDYPIVVQPEAYRPVAEMLESGTCEIGAQLHAWVTPPHEEQVSERNSYAGNLPDDLERRKLEVLVEAIERRFHVRPRLYRAGRYGTGDRTCSYLDRLGFDVDCSVVPGGYWPSPHAPDYLGGTARPYWLPTRRPVLEIPATVGNVGLLRHRSDDFYRRVRSGLPGRLYAPAFLVRTGLHNRVRLSPEGNTLEESKQLTRRLIADGYRVFAISYHSSSLEPGNTPYVRTQADLDRFLRWIERYIEFFLDEMDGVPDTPGGVYAWALANSPPVGHAAAVPAEA
jgi:glycosyltransferase involved in cell wall biosynthesis